MKRMVVIAVVGVIAGACDSDASPAQHEQDQESRLELMFVANEGVMVTGGANKVLIDALFTRPNPAYAAPPQEMLQQMETGTPPFDDVDLVLVTHNHPDHFSPSFAGRFLAGNPGALLVAPEDAVEALRDSVQNWSTLSERVISIGLEPGTSAEQTIDGIEITAYRTLHSGQHEDPQNLMYLVDMGDKTVFHEGDSDGHPDTFGLFDIGENHIDLALVHFWFPTSLEAERTLTEILKADHVGLFHLPLSLREDAPQTLGQVMPNYPDMFLLMTPGETRSF